jgi:hypothetical protein
MISRIKTKILKPQKLVLIQTTDLKTSYANPEFKQRFKSLVCYARIQS